MCITFALTAKDTRDDRESDDAVGWTVVKDWFGK